MRFTRCRVISSTEASCRRRQAPRCRKISCATRASNRVRKCLTAYGTSILNEPSLRNPRLGFMFQLTAAEWENLKSQIVISSWGAIPVVKFRRSSSRECVWTRSTKGPATIIPASRADSLSNNQLSRSRTGIHFDVREFSKRGSFTVFPRIVEPVTILTIAIATFGSEHAIDPGFRALLTEWHALII